MGKRVILKNEQGVEIYPKTVVSNILNGMQPLDEYLNNLDAERNATIYYNTLSDTNWNNNSNTNVNALYSCIIHHNLHTTDINVELYNSQTNEAIIVLKLEKNSNDSITIYSNTKFNLNVIIENNNACIKSSDIDAIWNSID